MALGDKDCGLKTPIFDQLHNHQSASRQSLIMWLVWRQLRWWLWRQLRWWMWRRMRCRMWSCLLHYSPFLLKMSNLFRNRSSLRDPLEEKDTKHTWIRCIKFKMCINLHIFFSCLRACFESWLLFSWWRSKLALLARNALQTSHTYTNFAFLQFVFWSQCCL